MFDLNKTLDMLKKMIKLSDTANLNVADARKFLKQVVSYAHKNKYYDVEKLCWRVMSKLRSRKSAYILIDNLERIQRKLLLVKRQQEILNMQGILAEHFCYCSANTFNDNRKELTFISITSKSKIS